MKVVILAIARTGSTSLAKAIRDQGYFTILEPYAGSFGKKYEIPLKEAKLYSKFCVKTVITQTQGLSLTKNETIDFYLNVLRDFDKVILLDRKNTIEHTESLAHLDYLHGLGITDLHLKYDYDIIADNEKEKFYNKAYDILISSKDMLNTIAYRTQNKIIYYEDIFNSNKDVVIDNLSKIFQTGFNLDRMAENLDVKNKYRVTKKSTI